MQQPQQPGKILEELKKARRAYINCNSGEAIKIMDDLIISLEDLSAPASHVEEKTDKASDQDFKDASAMAYLSPQYCYDRPTNDAFIEGYLCGMANSIHKPSPVIEIGESELLDIIKEMLQAFGHIGGIGRDRKAAVTERALKIIHSKTTEKSTPASHPAPDSIVGERTHKPLEGDMLGVLNKTSDRLFQRTAPTEQALPEEVDKDWESRKIDRLAEVIGMSEDHIRELQEEIHQKGMEFTQLLAEFKTMQAQLESAHALIKEKQEWINSHI